MCSSSIIFFALSCSAQVSTPSCTVSAKLQLIRSKA
uniref:Uncharacterized protein n=1 Tax=Setaria viridis TaxID=4556 RepID=A0A4U6SVE1_SETVI|nr:hypothetical protein SEVIR_9G150350v2 [Setaria viridis]